MGIQQFEPIMQIWNIVFFAILIFCIINSIIAIKRLNRRYILSYLLEAITIIVNLIFMYIIESRYIDYGNDKFSGLNSMGDWLGFGILIIITSVPLIITVICNIRYRMKGKSKRNSFEKEGKQYEKE